MKKFYFGAVTGNGLLKSLKQKIKIIIIDRKKTFNTLWPLFMDGVQLPQG